MLIEEDLQIMIRKYLKANEHELIDKDDRFSTTNYSSRKSFSIETLMLEKYEFLIAASYQQNQQHAI